MSSITDWLASIVNTDPKTQSYSTDVQRQEAEAVHYLAESLRSIYTHAHSQKPEAKRLMYSQINTTFCILSGKPVPKPAAAVVEKVDKPKPQTHIERVKATVELLNKKKDELRKYRKEECSKLMKTVDVPGKRDPVSKMEPAKNAIEAKIAEFNNEVKIWNGKLPNLVRKLDNRYKAKIVPNRLMLTPEKVKEIKRDTGLSITCIVNAVDVHIKHQESLEDKAKALEDGLKKAYKAFAEFENQIERAINAYKYGGEAGNETLAAKGIGLPYDPNLKEVKFTELFKIKSVEEVRKQILEEKAKRAAKPRSKPVAKKSAEVKVKRLKSPVEKDAPELLSVSRPAAAAKPAAALTTGEKMFKEKKP